MAANDQVCWFISIFLGIVIDDKFYILRNVIPRFRFITRTETDTEIVSPVTYDAQKVAPSAPNFNDIFLIQTICRDEFVRECFGVLAKPRREHLRVLVLLLVLCGFGKLIIVSAIEYV